MNLKSLFSAGWLLALLLPLCASAASAGSGNVKASLVAEVDAIVPGEPFWVALKQEIRPGWHTYWRNPGDSGAPTTIEFDLPEGFSVSDIHWPVPERIAYGPLMNFGYKGELWLPVEITPPADLAADSVALDARADWLVCADICIPEGTDLSLTLPVSQANGPSPSAFGFDAVRQQIPQEIGVDAVQTNLASDVRLVVDLPGLMADRIQNVTFFPFTEGAMENPSPQRWELVDGGIAIEVEQGWDFTPDTRLDGILVIEENSGEALVSAFEIQPQLDGATSAAGPAPSISLAAALGFAFLGGLILNLMPCVFPVLSIKILSLMSQVGSHSSRIRLHGWVYLAGVVLSFVAVAVALIALRSGGAQIGWGFQLQSPLVVGLLAYLFFAIGLNLFGYFEIGTSVMNVGQSAAGNEGLSGSFFTGVLATVVAAPCTVPFMATAVGFALTQSNLVALMTFASLGLGMAAPYLLLCYSPAAMDRLPRPGPWMARFKEALAFPMFATAIWLVWVLSQQSGASGVLAVGAGTLLIAFAIWLAKHLTPRIGVTIAALMIAVALYFPTTLDRGAAASETAAVVAASPRESYAGPVWDTWSPERVAELRASGPVFVNFTAAWCITCKVNEAVALDSARVREAFEANSVSYLKGDWTNEDPAITRALEEYQRSGVPLYLLYAPGNDRAEVLPQVLTESIVLRAIEEI